MILNHSLNILRPVYHGRDAGGRRSADAHQANLRQIFSLHNGVGALGSPKHRLGYALPVDPRPVDHFAESAEDPVINVFGRGMLHLRHHLQPFVDDHSVRIRAAHIYTKLIHRFRLPSHALPAGYNRYPGRNTGGRPAPGRPACATCHSISVLSP